MRDFEVEEIQSWSSAVVLRHKELYLPTTVMLAGCRILGDDKSIMYKNLIYDSMIYINA